MKRTVFSFAFALFLASGTVQCQDFLTPSEAVIQEEIRRSVNERWFMPSSPTQRQVEDAKIIADRGMEIVEGEMTRIRKEAERYSTSDQGTQRDIGYVFASLSIPEKNLRKIVEDATSTGAVIVFRGVPKGGNIGDIVGRISALLDEKQPVPSVIINPLLFTQYSVLSVPTVVLPGHIGEGFSKISGLVNVDWMIKDRQRAGVKDYGKQGITWEIIEPDLIEEMKSRIAKVDWEGMKNRAVDRFWSKQKVYQIKQAKTGRTQVFDPTMVVARDVVNSDGKVMLEAGTAVNPLHSMPLTKKYVIFDARLKSNVEFATRIRDENMKVGRGVSFIISNLETEKGWEGFSALNAKLGNPVFLMNDKFLARFKITALPSVIEARGDKIVITEYEVK